MNEWYLGELKKAAKIIDNNRRPRVAILHNVKYKIKRFFSFVLYCITLCKDSFGKWEADERKNGYPLFVTWICIYLGYKLAEYNCA